MRTNTATALLLVALTGYASCVDALPLSANVTAGDDTCTGAKSCTADVNGDIKPYCCANEKPTCCAHAMHCCYPTYTCANDAAGTCLPPPTTTTMTAPDWKAFIIGARCDQSGTNCAPVTLEVGHEEQGARIANGDTSHAFPNIINRAGVRAFGRAYLIGGLDDDGCSRRVNYLDDQSSTATTDTSMPVELQLAAAATDSDGNIIVYGGKFQNNSHSSGVYMFDGDNWKRQPHELPYDVTRIYHTMTAADGTIFVIGGETAINDAPSDNVFAYHYGKWSTRTKCPVTISQHSAVLTSENEILVCGGYQDNQLSSNCFLYSPREDSWSKSPQRMQKQRAGHAMVRRGYTYYIIGGGIDHVESYDKEKGGKLENQVYDNKHTVAVPLQTM